MIDHSISCRIDGREYTITPEEIQEMYQEELEKFESVTPMTPAEKRALRKWVASGHSINDNPGSRYVCLGGITPPPDFLSVYRMDRELRQALKGKTKKEKEAYLKNYFGYVEETEEEKILREARAMTPDIAIKYIHERERECFCLWDFLYQKNLASEAMDYVEAHKDMEILSDW